MAQRSVGYETIRENTDTPLLQDGGHVAPSFSFDIAQPDSVLQGEKTQAKSSTSRASPNEMTGIGMQWSSARSSGTNSATLAGTFDGAHSKKSAGKWSHRSYRSSFGDSLPRVSRRAKHLATHGARMKITSRFGSSVDVMFVFPKSTTSDEEKVLASGIEHTESGGAMRESTEWYLGQVFTESAKELMEAQHEKHMDQAAQRLKSQWVATENAENDESDVDVSMEGEMEGGVEDGDDDWNQQIASAWKAALAAQTWGELRSRIVDLLIIFLLGPHIGFQVRAFSSNDGNELFVAVAASEGILRAHADEQGYKLQLAHQVSCALLRGDFKNGEISPPYVKYDVDEEMTFEQVLKEHTEERLGGGKIHAHIEPFAIFKDTYEVGSIFSGADRIRLIMSTIHSYFDLQCLSALGIMNCHYPCHLQQPLSTFQGSWVAWDWHGVIPFSRAGQWDDGYKISSKSISRYFGAKLGFRVHFWRFLTKAVSLLALLWPSTFFMPAHWVQVLTGVTLIIWGCGLGEFWKREEARQQMLWGMDDFDVTEKNRPQFQGEKTLSDVDRSSWVKTYPPHKRILRRIASMTCSILYTAAVFASIMVLYEFRDKLQGEDYQRTSLAITVLVSLQLGVANHFWDYAAEKLASFDNYEKDSQYHDALTLRIFGVRFTTYCSSLFYVAFVKKFTSGCGSDSCEAVVASQLRANFLIDIMFTLSTAIWPCLVYFKLRDDDREKQALLESRRNMDPHEGVDSEVQELQELQLQTPRTFQNRCTTAILSGGCDASGATTESPDRHESNRKSYDEAQRTLPQYSVSEDISDRLDVFIELGYVLFFGILAPDIIILFLVSTMIRLYVLGSKLSQTMQRPFPEGALGLGVVFNKVFHVISYIAVISNIFLLLMINAMGPMREDIFENVKKIMVTSVAEDRIHDWKAVIVVFLVIERGVSLTRTAIDELIPDTPASVELEKRRRQETSDRLHQMVVLALKKYEGNELKHAYEETMPLCKKLMIIEDKQWVPAPIRNGQQDVHSVTDGKTPLPRWTQDDDFFEEHLFGSNILGRTVGSAPPAERTSLKGADDEIDFSV